MPVNEYEVSFHGDKNVRRLDSDDAIFSIFSEYTKTTELYGI